MVQTIHNLVEDESSMVKSFRLLRQKGSQSYWFKTLVMYFFDHFLRLNTKFKKQIRYFQNMDLYLSKYPSFWTCQIQVTERAILNPNQLYNGRLSH